MDKVHLTAFSRAHEEVESFSRDTKSIARISLDGHATPQTMVKSFHMIYGVPAPSQHTPMSVTTRDRRLRLILEEFLELTGAAGFRLGVNSAENYREGGRNIQLIDEERFVVEHIEGSQQDPIEIMDALADIIYVTYGFAIELGLNLDEVLREVHAANLTKLGADGKPIVNGHTPGYRVGEANYRNDLPVGKIIKGPGYMPPQIHNILRHKLAKENKHDIPTRSDLTESSGEGSSGAG